jgi:hypothetical protein
LTVAGDVGLEARSRQQLRHEPAETRIILDNQHACGPRTLVTHALRMVPIRQRTLSRGSSHHGACSASHVTGHAEDVCT